MSLFTVTEKKFGGNSAEFNLDPDVSSDDPSSRTSRFSLEEGMGRGFRTRLGHPCFQIRLLSSVSGTSPGPQCLFPSHPLRSIL